MRIFADGFFETFTPDPEVTVSEWADAHRKLDAKASSEPGRWRTSRTPYLRDIMDDLSVHSPVTEVIFQKGAQVGGTEAGNNWVAYMIAEAPGPMLLVQPTVEIAKRYGSQRLNPMFASCEKLKGRIEDKTSRRSTNTQKIKDFPGGTLILGGANSAAALRSMPIRYLFLDEVDAYPPDCEGEGSPVTLATRRTNTFARKKIFLCSTPTIEETSVIHHEYEMTDQRRYFVPCPDCGHMDYLRWDRFLLGKNEKGESTGRGCTMFCEDCGAVIQEHQKATMLAQGEWRATKPENAHPKRVGYHLSGLYSPLGWLSWDEIGEEWVKAQGDPVRLKTFINTVLGEVWRDGGDRANEHDLLNRCEDYGFDPVPAGVALITVGVDVQPDRLELEIVGWGKGEESWSLDYLVLWGDPEGVELWKKLDFVVARTFRHPAGATLKISRTFIDSGGANTQAVYSYAKRYAKSGFLYAIKGVAGTDKPAVGHARKTNIKKIPLFPLGVHTIKDSIYHRLKIEEPGPGYCHFPQRTLAYFEGLTSEECRTRRVKGRPIREYHLRKGRRNEPLDCRVYAYAAMLSLAGVSVDGLARELEKRAGDKRPNPSKKQDANKYNADP